MQLEKLLKFKPVGGIKIFLLIRGDRKRKGKRGRGEGKREREREKSRLSRLCRIRTYIIRWKLCANLSIIGTSFRIFEISRAFPILGHAIRFPSALSLSLALSSTLAILSSPRATKTVSVASRTCGRVPNSQVRPGEYRSSVFDIQDHVLVTLP